MIKLFRKLHDNGVTMFIEPNIIPHGDTMSVVFIRDYWKMRKAIVIDEFTDVWGGDHVIEHVLERYLDEFLEELHKHSVKELGKLAK